MPCWSIHRAVHTNLAGVLLVEANSCHSPCCSPRKRRGKGRDMWLVSVYSCCGILSLSAVWIQKNKHGLYATFDFWCPKGNTFSNEFVQCLPVSLVSGGNLQIYALKCRTIIVVKMIMLQRHDNHILSLYYLSLFLKMISKNYFVMIILINYRYIIKMCIKGHVIVYT